NATLEHGQVPPNGRSTARDDARTHVQRTVPDAPRVRQKGIAGGARWTEPRVPERCRRRAAAQGRPPGRREGRPRAEPRAALEDGRVRGPRARPTPRGAPGGPKEIRGGRTVTGPVVCQIPGFNKSCA